MELDFQRFIHYHDREHGSVQADRVLEKELRVPHLDPQAVEGHFSAQCRNMGDLKANPYSDTLPPTSPYLLIVPLPMGPTFNHESMGAKPIQTTMINKL